MCPFLTNHWPRGNGIPMVVLAQMGIYPRDRVTLSWAHGLAVWSWYRLLKKKTLLYVLLGKLNPQRKDTFILPTTQVLKPEGERRKIDLGRQMDIGWWQPTWSATKGRPRGLEVSIRNRMRGQSGGYVILDCPVVSSSPMVGAALSKKINK